MERELEILFPELELFAILGRIGRRAPVAEKNFQGARTGGNDAIGVVFENLLIRAAGAAHLTLDSFVLLDGEFILVLVGGEFIAANLDLGVRRGLLLLGRLGEGRGD